MEIALGHINVDNICAKISIEYGNKICNEFSRQAPKNQELCPNMNQKIMQTTYRKIFNLDKSK